MEGCTTREGKPALRARVISFGRDAAALSHYILARAWRARGRHPICRSSARPSSSWCNSGITQLTPAPADRIGLCINDGCPG